MTGFVNSKNPLAGFSHLQMEIYLDCLDRCRTVGMGDLKAISEQVKSYRVPEGKYLEIPQVIVEKLDSGYSAGYNAEINKSLERKLPALKKERFYLQLLDDWAWAEGRQVDIVEYLCNQQAKYLESGNPLYLKKITQEDVAKVLKVHPTTVGRLVKNLSAMLPDGTVFFADKLITGAKMDQIRIVHVLQEIEESMESAGKPRIPDSKMVNVLRDLGFEISRRAVNNYRNIIKRHGREETRLYKADNEGIGKIEWKIE